jgi:hypothetical protein
MVRSWRAGGGEVRRPVPLSVRVLGRDGPMVVLLLGMVNSGRSSELAAEVPAVVERATRW